MNGEVNNNYNEQDINIKDKKNKEEKKRKKTMKI